MKKSLVALATLSVVGTAFADVDVSGGIKLYGVVDQAATRQTLTNPAATTGSTQTYTSLFASQATSRFGFKGNRDLGSGIQGKVQAEIQIEPDNSALIKTTANRTGLVALVKEDAGEIQLGTMETTAYEVFGMDANGRVEYKPQVWRTTTSDSLQDRANNSIKYISPSFQGVNFHYHRGLSDSVGTSAKTFQGFGLKYKSEKLNAALVYDKIDNVVANYKFAGIINAGPSNEGYSSSTPAGFNQMNTAYNYAGSTTTSTMRQIASVSYMVNNIYLNYLYAKSYSNTVNAGSNTTNTFGIRLPMDQFSFNVSYGTGTIDSYSSTHTSPTVTTSSAGTNGVTKDAKISDLTIGIDYNIDKSSKIYILSSRSGFVGGGAQDGTSSTVAVGARYNF